MSLTAQATCAYHPDMYTTEQDFRDELSAAIKRLRTNDYQLALAAGIGNQQVRRYRRGERSPTLKHVLMIRAAIAKLEAASQ